MDKITECPVCYEDMEYQITVNFPCRHSMCISCFCKLKSFTCAMCRSELKELVPESMKISSHMTVPERESSIWARYYTLYDLELDFYLAFAGQRVRQEVIGSRIRRLLRNEEVPLFSNLNRQLVEDVSSEDNYHNTE